MGTWDGTCTEPQETGVDFDRAGAAVYLKTTPRHIKRLQQQHRIAFYRIGGLVRYRRVDLDRFLEEARVESGEVHQ